MNLLKKIFKEHYEEMLYILHPRSSVIENVKKNMLFVQLSLKHNDVPLHDLYEKVMRNSPCRSPAKR